MTMEDLFKSVGASALTRFLGPSGLRGDKTAVSRR